MNLEAWHAIWKFFDRLRVAGSRGRGHIDMELQDFSSLFLRGVDDKTMGEAFTSVLEGYSSMSSEADFNLFPSDIQGKCRSAAVFVALDAKSFRLKSRHKLTFEMALVELVRWAQGNCSEKAEQALLIVSSWDQDAIDQWLGNIRRLNLARFDILLRTGAIWTYIDGKQL